MRPDPPNKAKRPGARQRGYGTKWEKEAKTFLAAHPRCACGCGRPSEVVDHIKPHKGDRRLFWSRSNWQALAKTCHDSWKQSEEKLGYSTKIGSDGMPTDERHPFNR